MRIDGGEMSRRYHLVTCNYHHKRTWIIVWLPRRTGIRGGLALAIAASLSLSNVGPVEEQQQRPESPRDSAYEKVRLNASRLATLLS